MIRLNTRVPGAYAGPGLYGQTLRCSVPATVIEWGQLVPDERGQVMVTDLKGDKVAVKVELVCGVIGLPDSPSRDSNVGESREDRLARSHARVQQTRVRTADAVERWETERDASQDYA